MHVFEWGDLLKTPWTKEFDQLKIHTYHIGQILKSCCSALNTRTCYIGPASVISENNINMKATLKLSVLSMELRSATSTQMGRATPPLRDSWKLKLYFNFK